MGDVLCNCHDDEAAGKVCKSFPASSALRLDKASDQDRLVRGGNAFRRLDLD